MHTYLPADATIIAYLKHYLRTLDLDKDTEECRYRVSRIVWVPLGASGRVLLNRLLKLLPDQSLASCVETGAPTAIYDRETKKVSFSGIESLDDSVLKSRFADREVIVLDSSVHTGSSMRELCRVIQSAGPKWVSTFTFCLKRGAIFVPNYFGILIHDWDRALFWLDAIPVNRLDKNIYQKNIQLRRFEKQTDFDDLDRSAILGEGYNVSEFNQKDHEGSSFFNYTCSVNNIVTGFLVFQWVDDKEQGVGCRIHRIRVTQDAKDLNTVLLLLRWAETCARHNRCSFIELRCADKKISHDLANMGFELVKETGFLRRKIIYGIKTKTSFPEDESGHVFSQPVSLP